MRPATEEDRRGRELWIVLGLAAAIGALLRAWVFASPVGQLDADEAVWGLMAKHVLEGEFPAFFWGQTYGGTIEVFLTAPFYALFGPHKLTVELVPLLLDVASALLVWRIALRLVGEPAARIAGALFWVWPAYSIWKSTKAHGFYAAGMVLVLLTILLAFRLLERIDARDAIAFGLVVGAGWWTTPQTIFVSLPLAFWVFASKPGLFRKLHLVAAGAAVGAAPWILYSVRHGWAAAQGESTVSAAQGWVDNVVGIFRNGWPAILGLRVPWAQQWVFTPWLGRAVYAGIAAAFVWFFWRMMFGKGNPSPPVYALALILAIFPVILSLSSRGSYTAEPRYFYLITPVVVLFLVVTLKQWTVLMGAIALAAAILTSAAGLAFMSEHKVTSFTVPDVQLPPDVGPAIEVLEAHDVRHVHAHYWIAYLITFWTDERIIASPDVLTVRNEEWAAEVAADPEAAHVFAAGSGLEGPYVESLETGEIPYERFDADGFVVYIPHPS